MGYIGRRGQGINQAHVNRYSEEIRGATTTNDYAEIFSFTSIDFNSVAIIPAITNTNSLDIRVDVAYRDPKDESATGTFVWYPFDEKTISSTSNPKDNTITFTSFDTGIARVRIMAKPATNNQHPQYHVYFRAEFVQGQA